MSAYDSIWARMPQLPSAVPEKPKTFWCKDLPEFAPAANGEPPTITRGGMWAPQRLWWDMDAKKWIRVFVGGYGSGKTNILCKRMIQLALENAPAPTAVTSPNYKMAKGVLLRAFKEILEGKRQQTRGAFNYRIKLTIPIEIEVYHGGRSGTIELLSADNPDHLKGRNLAAAGMDEPFLQDYEVFKQLVARLRDPRTKRKELVIAGTPEGVSNWGQSLCEGELFEQYKGAVGLVRASTLDNLATGQRYVDDMFSTYVDERLRAAYLEGQFVNLSNGVIYYGYDKSSNCIELPIPRGAKFGVGMDFNVNPMAFCVFWHTADHLHYMKEYELPNSDTEFAAQTLREEWGADLISTYPDASGKHRTTNAATGKSDFSILQSHGFRIHANSVNPARKDRYNAMNNMLRPGLGSKVGITISPTGCKKLCSYLSQYTYENMNAQEHMSHLLDAAGYPVAYLFPIVRPTVRTAPNFA